MREIKFRAWHKVNGAFRIATLAEIWKNGWGCCEQQKGNFKDEDYQQGIFLKQEVLNEFSKKAFDPSVAVWEQFTGLHDKNGKKIYEGDVVVWVDISGSGRELAYPPRVVKWYRDTCNYNVSTPVAERTIEVIGNIHENPELLEK